MEYRQLNEPYPWFSLAPVTITVSENCSVHSGISPVITYDGRFSKEPPKLQYRLEMSLKSWLNGTGQTMSSQSYSIRYGRDYKQRFFSRVANEGSDSTGICFSLCPQSLLLITGSLVEKRVMGVTEWLSINKNELNSSLSRIRERRRPARLRANEFMVTEINRLNCNKTKYKRWNTITRNRNQKSASPS